MKLELIKTAVTSRAGLAVLAVQQKSPTLLLGAGVVGSGFVDRGGRVVAVESSGDQPAVK